MSTTVNNQTSLDPIEGPTNVAKRASFLSELEEMERDLM